MSQLLHASACSVKETEDGNLAALTLGAVSINAADLIPLVGEQIVLRTPGQKARSFGGSVTALLVKDGKHGPEVTMKIAGAVELNSLVGTNVTIEAAQMDLPVRPNQGEAELQYVRKENEQISRKVDEADNPYSGVVEAVGTVTPKPREDYPHPPAVGAANVPDPADGKHPPKPDDLENF